MAMATQADAGERRAATAAATAAAALALAQLPGWGDALPAHVLLRIAVFAEGLGCLAMRRVCRRWREVLAFRVGRVAILSFPWPVLHSRKGIVNTESMKWPDALLWWRFHPRSSPETMLRWCCHYGLTEGVQALLAAFGATVLVVPILQARNSELIRQACAAGHRNVVLLLLDHGVPLDDLRRFHCHAIRIAASHGHLSTLRALCRRGLKLDDLRSDSSGALRLACSFGHLDTARFLLRQGMTLHDLRADNNFALRLAVQRGHRRVVALLLAQGLQAADLRAGQNEALVAAGQAGDGDLARLLFCHGLGLWDLWCAARELPPPRAIDLLRAYSVARVQALTQALGTWTGRIQGYA
jgi:ankyrin repeat protein